MKELFRELRHVPLAAANGLLLLDTCFIVSMAEQQRLDEVRGPRIATTSFNLGELDHIHHHLHGNVKHALRSFLKRGDLIVVDIPVVPGERERERAFVQSIDASLLREIPDASDAVLAAVALATKSDILTKDKHHLFTTVLKDHFMKYGVRVEKEWRHGLRGEMVRKEF
ncbi:hypothetical protein D6789_00770 [Candidatus Woesearchaeota archaeon]|nr:MAG: hypothetical protein D6789_00770 [Candidatus Woesearchaeota archaeon]